MSTRILNDIHNDLKQLITALTSFEEDEEGFRICERFCLSNIKHHRYLSVNSHATKEAINALITKFSIHGKYEVAKKFQELIDSFLSSFDFEQHPQYDLQWYLLTFLLDLSTETHKSNLDSLKLTRGEHSFNATSGNEDSITEEIDWAQYLKEGQENFFCDFKSDSDSEWSDLTEEGIDENDISLPTQICNTQLDIAQPPQVSDGAAEKFSLALVQNLESRKWLQSNVQTDWWNNLKCQKYPVIRRSCDTSICDIWHETSLSTVYKVATLSEYQVCRELLWMFYVQTSMVVFQQESESKFSIRSDISIPSLTTTAFKSILTPFCEYLSMIYDIERFGADLQPAYNEESELRSPPLTYEAYNAALRQHLNEFKTEVINMEKDIMKQEKCNTFLSLSANLRSHLNTIKILYDVHQNVIIDWKVSSNWKCASRLLSSLYYEMQNSHSRERTNICINLYLRSLTVYLNIIDTWLSEGRLEDWRDEFIIVRVTEDENDEQTEKFTIRLSDNVCLTDPIMQLLLQKVQHMGHSIELLVSLDRIADIWRMDNENNDVRISLSTELQNKLLSEISKYSPSVEETDTVLQIDKISLQEHDADIEKNIIQQLSSLHNPFLMKAMEDYMPCELYKNDTVDARAHNAHDSKAKQGQIHNLYKELQKIGYILPMQNILENTLSEILILRYNSASKLVKNIMIEEYKLQTHLKLLRFVYMMEAGHVMNKFYQILFYEIENNQMWANSYFLSCILEEVFSQYWPDTSSRWSITVHGNISTHQVLQAVNSITLHYTVEWPISIVLTKKVLEKYNEIFRFQLKLKWALWTLNNLRFCDLEDSKSPCIRDRLEQFHIRRLECLRFWLLHAIGSIHTYLSGQVLQSLGFILEKVLAQADSLDTIISVHNEYLNKVHEHCLLTEEFEDLMATINNMIEMCIHIRDRWSRKKLLLAATELDVMEHSYIKYHTYLALALHNAVQHKDADYLTALSSAFNCSMPCA